MKFTKYNLQTLDPISILLVVLMPLRQATTAYAGESGVQLSVGAEMEAYGDQAANR